MPAVEGLEGRTFLSGDVATPHVVKPAKVLTAYFDNRGSAFFTVSVALNTATLSRKTAAIYTAGTDGTFGTADDVRQYTAVGYKKGRLSLRATVPLNQRYRVRLNANVIQDVNGRFLDGEFNGNGVASGNGRGGGSYDITTQNAAKTRARFTTVAGYINVGLYTKTVAATCQNFVTYANAGDWDNTFFHRASRKTDSGSLGGLDVIQGGGYNVVSGSVGQVTDRGGIATQGVNSNAKGTIAMANTGQPNSNTNQWFFNTTANTNLDGNYSVFGAVLDAESQRTVEAINFNLPRVNAGAPFDNLPVTDPAAGTSRQVDPSRDLVMITRVAMLMDPAATPGAPFVAHAPAATSASAETAAPAVAPAAAASPFAVRQASEDELLA